MAHSCIVRDARGRSATVDLHLTSAEPTSLDPAYRLSVDPIVALSAALWDVWIPRQWILRPWSTEFHAASEQKHVWKNVTNPISAAAASCCRIGWSSPSPGKLLTDEGYLVDLLIMCPKSVKALAERSTWTWLGKQMIRRDSSMRTYGPEAVPWLYPLQRLTKRAATDDWTTRHCGLLR